MRVIAGTAGRINLVTPRGDKTRPTTDRVKETLFNILQPYLFDCIFYDLFAGSGGIGIEALSRGAAKAFFSDNSPEAIACIRENLKNTGLSEKAVVSKSSFEMLLKQSREKADIVFLDPPYQKGLEIEALRHLKESNLLKEDTMIIIETAPNQEYNDVDLDGFEIFRVKEYGNLKHVFLHPKCDGGL